MKEELLTVPFLVKLIHMQFTTPNAVLETHFSFGSSFYTYLHFCTFPPQIYVFTHLPKVFLQFLCRLAWKISLISSGRSPSTGGEEKEGFLLRRRAAFPLKRRTESLWKRWRRDWSSSFPELLAWALASFINSSAALLCHPPSVSTESGMKQMPSYSQAAR